jgi:hypothetical protein
MTFMTSNLVMGVVIFAMFWCNATTKGTKVRNNNTWVRRNNTKQAKTTKGEQRQHKVTRGK